jgi:hypothetical protein
MRVTRGVFSALRVRTRAAGANRQRFALGMTSFSAVCVAENRATFVYVSPTRFASAKTCTSRKRPEHLGCTTEPAPWWYRDTVLAMRASSRASLPHSR